MARRCLFVSVVVEDGERFSSRHMVLPDMKIIIGNLSRLNSQRHESAQEGLYLSRPKSSHNGSAEKHYYQKEQGHCQ